MKSVLFQLIFVYHFCGVQLRCPFQEVFLVSNSSVQFRSLIRPKKKSQSVSEHARLVLCYFHHFYLIVILRLWNKHCTCAQVKHLQTYVQKNFPTIFFRSFAISVAKPNISLIPLALHARTPSCNTIIINGRRHTKHTWEWVFLR